MAAHQTRRVLRMAWPIWVGQLAVIAHGFSDTMMTARYSTTDLAALALGGAINISVYMGLSGTLQALTPTIAHLFGAGRLGEIGPQVRQGAWLALFLAALGSLVLLFPGPLLSLAHASPELAEKATLYLRALAVAMPAMLGFVVYSAFNNAVAHPKMVMLMQVSGLALKVPLNAMLINGWFGLPALGGPGCAVATAMVYWAMLAAALLALRLRGCYLPFQLFGHGWQPPQWQVLRPLLRLGVPMGMSYFIEITGFTFMALLISRLGEAPLAGHQIAISVGSILYMLPLALAVATSALTAQSLGAGQPATARRTATAGLRAVVVATVLLGVAVYATRGHLARFYTTNPAVLAVAVQLLGFLAINQLGDGLQTMFAFILRAYRVTLAPTLIFALTLWGVGLGGGVIVGLDPFQLHPPAALAGANGFWFCNMISLLVLSCGFCWLLLRVQRAAMAGGTPLAAGAAGSG